MVFKRKKDKKNNEENNKENNKVNKLSYEVSKALLPPEREFDTAQKNI